MEDNYQREYDGFAQICAHNVGWRYDDSDNPVITELPESEEEHIKSAIGEGYTCGELCYLDYDEDDNEFEYYGWWEIVKN